MGELDLDRDDRPRTAQPPPVDTPGAESVHEVTARHLRGQGLDALADDLVERGAYGLRKYRQTLQVESPRDHVADAYEEALDAVAYLAAEVLRVREHPGSGTGVELALLDEAIRFADRLRFVLDDPARKR